MRQTRLDRAQRASAWRLKVGKEVHAGVFCCEISRDAAAPPVHVTELSVSQPKGATICGHHSGPDARGEVWSGPDNKFDRALPMRHDVKPGGSVVFYLCLRDLSSSARHAATRALISVNCEDISSMRRSHKTKLISEVIQTTAKATAIKADSHSIARSE
ncbi:hypothetical protein M2322_002790 [Rhodoblastus acidophilus]|uniref:hypothetical protein n=1 Tax=Rhodoblastus acidophilus TaxID=1074 RepID=UPI00222557BD|nr:hypothetical protein [Rhodoblastus acidophilus]MCW2317231.1 hypothetical protein [Rhodoblastus acidophilus]